MFIRKEDLNLAPNELVGLQMTILRILAFLPERPLLKKKVDRDKFRDRAISGERDNHMVQSSASDGEKRISADLSSSMGSYLGK